MYKGIVKIYRESGPDDTQAGRRIPEGPKKNPPQLGKLLDVEVVAKSQEVMVRKVVAILGTLDEGSE